MQITDSGICVQGFKASGIKEGKYGLAIILSEKEADCAMMITSNKIKAAPLIVSQENCKNGKAFGIVVNSENANAYTGGEGIEDARKMCKIIAGKFGLKQDDFIVSSTGVIGRRIDMDAIETLIDKASKSLESSKRASLMAAEAIMTTDTFPKMVSVKTRLNSGEVVEIGGIAKGAGMIAPELQHATMLCFLTTDAYVPKNEIKKYLEEAVEQSFNAVVVDGDTSTNDMVVLLANGLAGNKKVDRRFKDALNYVTRELAKMIAKDGEGATKFVMVEVRNASSDEDAKKVAKAIAGSNLVKASLFGEDPNWGRIIAAIGYSKADVKGSEISLYLGNEKGEVCLVERGGILAFQDSVELKEAKKILESVEIKIVVDLHIGNGKAEAYGCDLSYDYVKLNASYTS